MLLYSFPVISGPICSLIIASLQITFSSLLIHGILKQKTRFMIPMMVMYLIQIILILILSLIIVGVFMYLNIWIVVIIFVALFSGIIFLETYFLLIIRAHYFDMKRTKGQIHMSLNDQGGFSAPHIEHPPPYSDASPPATYYPDSKPPATYYPDSKPPPNY
ncbi:hypothetical protein Pcinc_018255 [Petrolisthes cinctipes]|uniref:Uncharacterized protein n=1 Tax=Petrolisthes cinctipes TaxID=88211 RepID=A0AAE1FMH1_PETCI|nr:hypothetical protein Pcinc_018255 [Petrolisthes cinctipes]